MYNVSVTINATEAVIDRNESSRLGLKYSVSDIRDVGKTNASRSYTISLPLEPNKVLFGFPDDIDSSDAYDNTTKYTATVDIDGNRVLTGFCKIIGVEIERTGESVIKVLLVGANGNWMQANADKLLSDLDLSDLDHTYTANTIVNSWNGTYDYLYPIVDFGKFQGGGGMNVEDFRPAINIKRTFLKCFNEAGYKVSSSFVDGSFFPNLWMLPGKIAGLDYDYRQARVCRVGLTTDQDISISANAVQQTVNIVLNNVTGSGFYQSTQSNWNTTTYQYVADAGALHRISFELKITPDAVPYLYLCSADLRIYKLHNGQPSTLAAVTFTIGNAPVYQQIATNLFKPIEAGDRIYVSLNISDFQGNGLEATIEQEYTVFLNQISPNPIAGSPIIAADWLPDRSCLDFIAGVRHLFNLRFYTDEGAKTVYIEPEDDFYLDNSQAVDWTNKLDVSKLQSITFIDDYSKFLTYEYASDGGDALVSRQEDEQGYPFMSHKHEFTNKFITGEESEGNEFFAPTLMRPCNHLDRFGGINVPTIWSEEEYVPEQSFEHEPRIVYYAGLVQHPSTWNVFGTERIYYPNAYSYDNTAANDNSLDFADSTTSKGLFAKYYTNTARNIDGGKLYKADFNLDSTDILSLDLRKPVLVGTTYYRINEVNGFNGDGTTEVELFKPATRRTHKPITEIALPLPNGWVGKAKPRLVPVLVEDTRLRPPTLVQLLVEDESGTLSPVYTEE